MLMFYDAFNRRRKKNPALKCFVDSKTFKQTIEVLKGKAEPWGIEIVLGDWKEFTPTEEYFTAIVSYPDAEGEVHDYKDFSSKCHETGTYVTVIADILALTLLEAPGEWGADAVVGNTQRLGVPMGAGGPHAAYFATTDKFKRKIPGRIIGVS